jgi:hypothetical protein
MFSFVDNIRKVANAAIKFKIHDAVYVKNKDLISKSIYYSHKPSGTEIGRKEVAVEAWIMPEGCVAPFMMKGSFKQKSAQSRDVFIRRLTPASLGRQKTVFNNILKKEPISSAIVGLPRIGKTQELNYHAICLFNELGCDGTDLKVLLLRIGFKIYNCQYDKESKAIQVTEHDCENLQEFQKYCNRYYDDEKSGKAVVIFDLQENEADPTILIPFITSLSSREVNSVLKTVRKTDGLYFFLYDLPSNLELEAMVRALHANAENNVVLKEHQNATIEEVMKIVRQRCDVIGNYLMYATCTQAVFQCIEAELSVENAGLALKSIEKCSIYNVPPDAKHFFSPSLREDVLVPWIGNHYIEVSDIDCEGQEDMVVLNQIYKWQFSSRYAEFLIKSAMKNDLKLFEMLHQLFGIIKYFKLNKNHYL